MYFVDRERIEQRLLFLEKQMNILANNQKWETDIEKLALERISHTVIEAILDVGNSMIDGFIMRDPGSYTDIIDILEDENVITDKIAESLKSLIVYRKALVQEYDMVSHGEILHEFLNQKEILIQFPLRVKEYLEKELGPVNAFKN